MAGGGFDDFDVERFQQRVDARITAVERLQTTLSSLVGRARDEDGLVSVEVSARGLSELELHPKAMRLSSGSWPSGSRRRCGPRPTTCIGR